MTPPRKTNNSFFPLKIDGWFVQTIFLLSPGPFTKITFLHVQGTNSGKSHGIPEAILIQLPTQPSMSTSVVAKSPGGNSLDAKMAAWGGMRGKLWSFGCFLLFFVHVCLSATLW